MLNEKKICISRLTYHRQQHQCRDNTHGYVAEQLYDFIP